MYQHWSIAASSFATATTVTTTAIKSQIMWINVFCTFKLAKTALLSMVVWIFDLQAVDYANCTCVPRVVRNFS